MVLSLKAWKSRSLPGLPRTFCFSSHDERFENGRHFWRPFFIAVLQLLARGPERRHTLPESFRLFGKKSPGKTLRRFQMHGAPCRNQRSQACSTGCEHLMRCRHLGKHRKVLTGPQPVAQALRLLGPYLSEAWPERLDQIHLVTMLDHAPAQVVQVFGVGI